MQSLYQKMLAANCEMDSHHSDLYVRSTETARKILGEFPTQRANATSFVSQTDGKLWIDIPFSFDPYWTSKQFPH